MPVKEIQTVLEHKECPVCGTVHTFECGILISKVPMEPFEEPVITGSGLCEKHRGYFDKGYVALVEVYNDENAPKLSARDVIRSGEVALINRSALVEFLEIDIEEDVPLIYCEIGAIAQLKELRDEVSNPIDLH